MTVNPAALHCFFTLVKFCNAFVGGKASGVFSLAYLGLPVEFLLLRYSVLFTVESLSLLYLHVISCFICSRR